MMVFWLVAFWHDLGEMSTTDEAEVKRLGGVVQERGGHAVDCPVSVVVIALQQEILRSSLVASVQY